MNAAAARSNRADVAGIPLEITEAGNGRPLLFLHGGHPSGRLDPQARIIEALGENLRIIAPTHPGFGTTPAPPQLTNIDDLAYLYLDLLDAMNLRDVILAGASLGGWIAAEMAVKTTGRISHLVLIDAVGIKPGDRETRDIADIYAITDRQLAEIAYADPQKLDGLESMPAMAKAAGVISMALWVGILSMGRWIAYFERPPWYPH